MIFSDFTYAGITFSRFVRGSGYMANAIRGDRIQIRSTKDGLPSQDGIQRYIDYYGSRLLEITGVVKGTSESDLYEKINALTNAFDLNYLQDNYEYGFAPLTWQDPGQVAARYFLKPLNNTLIISEDRTGLARRFSVLLEAKDPVKYLSQDDEFSIVVGVSGGSSSFPVGFPVAFGGVKNTGISTVINSGSVAIYPQSIKLYAVSGIWYAPSITNNTTDETISFTSDVGIEVGQYVEIIPSTGSMRLYRADGTSQDISTHLVSSSVFWRLNAGNNLVSVTGSSVGDNSYALIKLNSQF